MFEEFKKKNEFQAVQNNQMAQLIREQNKKPLYHIMPQMYKNKQKKEKKPEKKSEPKINQKMLEEFKRQREEENNKQEEEIKTEKNSNFNEVMQREPEVQSKKSNKIYREFKESQSRKEEEDIEKEIEKEKYNNLINKVKSLERELPKEEKRKINTNSKFTKNFVTDYKIEGQKYELIKLSDKMLKNDFVKNGFHVIDLKMDKDPINGRVNGKFNIRVRLNDIIDEEFEDYIRYRDMRIVSKRIF